MREGCTPWPDWVVRDYVSRGIWRAEGLADVLAERARVCADRIFVSDAAGALSFREVDRLAERVAVRLLELGLRRGDAVLFQLPNIREFIVAFFALQKIGAVPVMCLPPHRFAELSYFAELTAARAYIFPQRFRNYDYRLLAGELQRAAPSLQYLIATGDGSQAGMSYLDPWMAEPVETRDGAAALAACRPDPFDIAFFLLSGGTTGIPKLIPRTHADYLCNGRECARFLQWGPDTVLLVALPAAHNFPLGAPGMVAALIVGGRVALSATTDADTVFEAIERQGGTFLGVSPTLLMMLLESSARSNKDLRSLRCVYAGGQKMLPELVDRARATWDFAIPGQAFGMAEGLTNLTRFDDPWDVIRETQGRPVSPADEIRIIDDGGNDVAAGAVGELVTRGPYTIRGYFKSEQHNKLAFTADGFYRTGDMVRLHPSGNLIVEGRRKDMINRGGEKISAEEIENLILGHDDVQMVAVVAMPDPVMGERGCAFVIPRPGRSPTLEQVTHFLLDKKIAKYKLPERLEVVASFPLTAVGKISKKDLRDTIAAKLKAERAGAASKPASLR